MICLIQMPFGSLTRPSLGIGLIAAYLRAAELPVRTHYFSFDFARLIGFSAYEVIALFKGVETQVSEWLFAEAAWRRPFGISEEEFLRLCGEELKTIPNVTAPQDWLRKVRRKGVPHFLEQCYQQVVSGGVPRVVAFSCMFYQTLASLALGRLLKDRHPEIRVVYGGACFHGEMGEELFAKAPWIDAVSLGEADDIIPALFRTLLAGQVPQDLQGVLARDAAGQIYRGPPSAPVSTTVLEDQPDPDFDAFFADAARVGIAAAASWQERVTLMFESSRGCWWGQKKHCTFCGLNGEGMAFREKSAAVVLRTLKSLAERYPVRLLMATDNILPMSYFHTLLPQLTEQPLHVEDRKVALFFEVKANMNRSQVQALAEAGVSYIQPGIESLSSHILTEMDKGVSALQNVFLLKCCTQYGIVPFWNLLIRVPGEHHEDYQQMERWLPLLFHLRPPSGGAPRIECHRYSPYFFRRGKWIEELRPAQFYRGLFPSDEVDLAKVAYYFEGTWKHTLGDPAYDGVLRLIADWMQRWREQKEEPRLLLCSAVAEGAEIVDTRGEVKVCWQLPPLQAHIYRGAADIATPEGVRKTLVPMFGDALSESAVRDHLRRFVEQGLALEERDRFLALAVPPAVHRESQDRRRVHMRRVANQRPSSEDPKRVRLPLLQPRQDE